MRLPTGSPSRGIALIIVMLVIVVLSLLAAGFCYSMKVEMRLAQNVAAEADLLWAARSGVEQACALLAREFVPSRPQVRSLKQAWAGGPGDNFEMPESPPLEFRLGDTFCALEIIDLERKMNINFATREHLERALELLGYDTHESATVIDSIMDWKDPNQAALLNGAEEDYYMGLPTPYHCKDGPMDQLSELLLVKGVTPEMYWGPGRTNEIQRTHTLLAASADVPPQITDLGGVGGAGSSIGLVDLFSTYGQGRVNPNTASKEVLMLLPMVERAAAETVVSVRAGMDRVDGNEDDTPYETPTEIPVPPQIANAAFTMMSTTFEVRVHVNQGSYHRTYVAIVTCRDARSAQVLNAHWL